MLLALTHIVSPRINQCELMYRQREPIDYELAVEQHESYCQLLRDCGVHVVELSMNRGFPDATFIEDTAVVFDEVAVMANIGVVSRQGEVEGIEPEITKYRKIATIQPPATLDGGDILQIRKKLFVGLSARTNRSGAGALQEMLKPFGYEIVPVTLRNCLHLKSACTAITDDTLLVNTRWLDVTPFSKFQMIQVPESEPWAANVLRIEETLCVHAGFIQTIDMLRNQTFHIKTVDISELLKAEAGMTCSSILFRKFP